MAKVIESSRVTLKLQVRSRGDWGNVNQQTCHYTDAPSTLEYMKRERDRWEACRFFEDAPIRILWCEPSGHEFTV